MHKSFKWIFSFIIALVAMPVLGSSVFAESGDDQFEDGEYEIDYTVNYEGEDAPVEVDKFFNKPATLKIESGEQSIQLEHTASDMIDNLDVPDADVQVVSEDDEEKTRVVEINTDADLTEPIDMGLVMFYGQTHDVKVEFDLDGIPVTSEEPEEDDSEDNSAKDDSKKEKPVKEEEKKEEKATNESNDQNPKKEETKKDEPEKEETEKDVSNNNPDKAYEYDYVVKHETEDKTSAADSFFKKPATVLHKDGIKYIQLTVTDWDWIKSLSTADGDVHVVEVKDDGSAVIQFKVAGELSEAITLDMHVEVPEEVAGMPYDMDHKARLFLDLDSKKEVDAGDYTLSILDSDNNGESNGGNDTANDESNGTVGSNGDNSDGGEVANPHTGDTSNIWLYTLLLIGSITVPSAILFKRRFVHK